MGSKSSGLLSLTRRYSKGAKVINGVIIGPPGSGKGTISERIVRDFKLDHFSSGDILRSQIRKKTKLGLQIEPLMAAGQLVPVKLLGAIIEDEVLSSNNQNGWLLDGYPRSSEQAELLQKSCPPNMTIYLNVPFDTIISRIKSRWIHASSGRVYNLEFNPPKKPGVDDVTGEKLIQRDDDKPESVQKRLQVYQDMIQPVLDFYKERGLLHEFKGTESNVIYPKVKKFIEGFIRA